MLRKSPVLFRIKPVRGIVWLVLLSIYIMILPRPVNAADAGPKEGCITFLLDFCGADDSGGGYFAAEFQGWDPVPMCDYGGVWQISFCNIPAGTYQYKFLNGPDGWEFNGFGDVCTNPADNENRFVDISGGCDIEGPWCFQQCVAGSGSPADDVPPQITGDVPEDITISCTDDLPDMDVLEAEDECSYFCTSEWPEDDDSGLDVCGLGVIIRTWRVIDCAGNEGIPHEQRIFIQDYEAPQLTEAVEDITLDCGEPLPPAVPLEVEDDCDDEVTETFPPVDDETGLDADGTGDIIRTWYVEDCRGNFEEYRQRITVTGISVAIMAGDLCRDTAYLYTGEYDIYTWEVQDTSGQFVDLSTNQDTLAITMSGIYRLTVMSGNCTASVTDTIELGAVPIYSLLTGSACSESFYGNSSVDLRTLITLQDSTDSLSITDIDGNRLPDLFVDFDGQAPGLTGFLVEIFGDTLCAPVSDTLWVNVVDCTCPSVDSAGVVCVPKFRDSLDLSLLAPENYTGMWLLSPPDPGIQLAGDQLFIDEMVSPGVYNLLYVFENPDINANCSSITPPPNLTQLSIVAPDMVVLADDITACHTGMDPLFPSAVDLDTLLLSGQDGNWSVDPPLVTIGPDNVVDFSGTGQNTFTFTFTQSDQHSSCPADVGQIEVLVVDCSCPPAAIEPDSTVCNDGNTLNLEEFVLAGSGIWRYEGNGPDPAAGIRDEVFFDINGLQPGLYSFTFSVGLDDPSGDCDSVLSLELNVLEAPMPSLMVTDTSVCNQENPLDVPFVIDLMGLLDDQSIPGTWTSSVYPDPISDATAVSFEGLMPGAYVFTFSTDPESIDGGICQEVSIELTVNVDNCQCPELPELIVNDMCAGQDEISLDPVNPGAGSGTWYLDGPAVSDSIVNAAVVSATGLEEGSYQLSFQFDTISVSYVCLVETISYDFEVVHPLMFDIPDDITVCDRTGSSQGPAVIDLTAYASEQQGSWAAPPLYTGDFADPGSVSFEGLAGESHTFTFTSLPGPGPCPEQTFMLTVDVQDCSCPDLSFEPLPDFCQSDSLLVPQDYLPPGIFPGQFSLIDEGGNTMPVPVDGILFSELDAGSYILRYSASSPVPSGCDAFYEQSFVVHQPLSAGTPTDVTLCSGEPGMLQLSNQLEDADPGGQWFQVSGPSLTFDTSEPLIQAGNLDSGNYTFVYRVEPTQPCPVDESTVSIVVHPLPLADAGQDAVLDCDNPEWMLGEHLTGAGATYMWFDGQGNIIGNGSSVITVDTPGMYVLQAADDNTGCVNTDTVMVQDNRILPDLSYTVREPSCADIDDGIIEITGLTGGTGLYTLIVSGEIQDTIVTDSILSLTDLPAGDYSIEVISGSCQQQPISVFIPEASEFYAAITETTILGSFGESQVIGIDDSSIAVNDIPTVTWYTDQGDILCQGSGSDCGQINLVLADDLTLYVESMLNGGCIYLDSVKLELRIETQVSVYIPNIISRESFDDNRWLKVFAGADLEQLEQYTVYDRWGNIVYDDPEGKRIHDPDEDWWDGTRGGQPLIQGVYVLFVSYIHPDSGDLVSLIEQVTLIK